MFLFLCFHHAKAASGFEIWSRSTLEGKVQVLKEYKKFYETRSTEFDLGDTDENYTSFTFSLISESWAGSSFNCVYAGWPSKLVGKVCSSPARHNPEYNHNSCGQNQMQCQPLLFGTGLCVSTATSQQRSLAFSNCEKKKNKSPEDVVREIQAEGKEQALKEFLDFADEVCSSGKQASTGMCRRLKSSVDRLKAINVEPTSSKAPPTVKKTEPVVISEGKKLRFHSEEAQTLFNAVKMANTLNEAVDAKPSATPEECEDEKSSVTTSGYDRDEPRDTSFEHLTFLDQEKNGFDKGFIKTKEAEMIPMGIRLKSNEPNERSWWFVSKDNSKRETYLWLSDENGSGKVSQTKESIVVMIPRKVLPSAKVINDEIHVTLPTSEIVVYDKKTKIIKSGVFEVGKQGNDYASLKYNGPGISIRVNHRGGDPRRISGKAVVTQRGVTCEVSASNLWQKDSDFKYNDDQQLVDFLNSKCGKKFKL
jgi:hypothetical protein